MKRRCLLLVFFLLGFGFSYARVRPEDFIRQILKVYSRREAEFDREALRRIKAKMDGGTGEGFWNGDLDSCAFIHIPQVLLMPYPDEVYATKVDTMDYLRYLNPNSLYFTYTLVTDISRTKLKGDIFYHVYGSKPYFFTEALFNFIISESPDLIFTVFNGCGYYLVVRGDRLTVLYPKWEEKDSTWVPVEEELDEYIRKNKEEMFEVFFYTPHIELIDY